MSPHATYHYKFGEFSLYPEKRVLLRNDAPIALTPKAFDTLLVLVRENGRVVEKEDLLKEIWPDTFVGEATLAQNIFTLRKALGQKDGRNQFIETVPKHGYRFTADVTAVVEEPNEIVFEKYTTTRIVSEEMQAGDFVSEPASAITPHHRIVDVPNIVSSESRLSQLLGRKKIRLVAALAAVGIACALIAFSAVKLRERRSMGAASLVSRPLQLRRLTNNGHVVRATLSHDRRYVAYATEDNEKQSLWLKQVEATTDLQIVLPADVFYRGIAFAPDLASIFYVRFEPNDVFGKLYQMPLLGGTPKLIMSDIDSSLSFSPDGKRFAFFRNDRQSRKTRLFTANSDGSNLQQLSTYSGLFVSDGPAWSPDGKEIVFPLASGGDPNRNNGTLLMSRQVEDGVEKPITPRGWNGINGVGWLDNDNVVIVGWGETDTLATQVWKVSRRDGQARRITNDLNSYTGLSISSVTGALLTVQSDRVASFWIADATDLSNAKQITSGFGDRGGEFLGLSWTSPDKIVYGSTAAGGLDIWTMDIDGRNRKQLTVDPLMDLKPTVSPVDGSIVFVSRRTGAPHLWIISAAGLNPRQLTNGKTESYPSFFPDGKWVAYISIEDTPTLWKVPLHGGKPKQLTTNFTWVPSVSPDGKLIACLYRENPEAPLTLALIPAEGGAPVKVFPLRATALAMAGFRWSPDGSGIIYINNDRNVSNLWSQPINGKPPTQLTRFDSSQIFRFVWSPNGKQLMLERGSNFGDVVLITSFTETDS